MLFIINIIIYEQNNNNNAHYTESVDDIWYVYDTNEKMFKNYLQSGDVWYMFILIYY